MTITGKKKLKIFLILVIIFVAVLGISIALLGKYSNLIVKSELERRLGKNFSVERIDLTWGCVEAVGVPLALVVGALKTNNNEIPISFIIDGNLDNPQFNLQEEFVKKLAMGLAGKLGFSIEGIGQALLGGGVKGSENVGSSEKSIGEGLKKLLN